MFPFEDEWEHEVGGPCCLLLCLIAVPTPLADPPDCVALLRMTTEPMPLAADSPTLPPNNWLSTQPTD